LLPFGFAAFFAFGVVLVLPGANQQALARDLSLDLAGSGLLASALAAGIGLGVLGSGPLVDRLPRRPLFVGAALLAAGALLLADRGMGFSRACLHLGVAGAGLGAFETLLNAAVAEVQPVRATRRLLLVHSAATLGAVLGPPCIGWLTAQRDWSASFFATGGLMVLLAGWALGVRFPTPPRAAAQPRPPRPALSALLPFAAVGFAYVGVEGALTILAVPYAAEAQGLSAERGIRAISALWLGLLVGRLVWLPGRARIDARALAAAGAAGALLLAFGAGLGAGPVELLFGVVGAALGCVFPLMVALAGERLPDDRGLASGVVVAAGALGGFAIPWLHGAIGDAAGVAVGVASLAVWCVAIAAAALTSRRPRGRWA
jgi:fucose permease